MGYDKNLQQKEHDQTIHPSLRGIGFLFIFLIPLLSFVLADQVVKYLERNVGNFQMPPILQWDINIPVYGTIFNLPVVLIFTFIIAQGLFGVLNVINAAAYQATRNPIKQLFESEGTEYKKKRKTKKSKYKP